MGHLRIACSITPLRQPSRTLCDIGNLFLVGIKVVPENWDSKHWDSPFVVGVRMPQYPRLQSGFPMEKSRTGWTTSWSAYAQLTLRTPPLLCQMEIGMIECYIFGGLKSSTLINLLSQAFFSLNFPIPIWGKPRKNWKKGSAWQRPDCDEGIATCGEVSKWGVRFPLKYNSLEL